MFDQMGFWLDTKLNQPPSQFPSEIQFLSTQWGKIRYIDSGNVNKPSIVMVPDGPCVVDHLKELTEHLKENFRVISFDLPGFGFSFPENAYNHTFQSVSSLFLEVMNQLDIKKATISATCVNGFYALAFAKKYPERVEKLILAQTPSYADMEKWSMRMIPKLLRIPGIGQSFCFSKRKKIASAWMNYALPKGVQRPDWDNLAQTSLKQGGCNCLSSVVQGVALSSPADLEGVKVPVVMVWGAKDRSHKHSTKESLLKHVPHATLVEYSECGHFPNMERPQDFAQLFLSKN